MKREVRRKEEEKRRREEEKRWRQEMKEMRRYCIVVVVVALTLWCFHV